MLSKKERQRFRTMQFFIEAAAKIIEESGMQSLTIRKVADEASYNSATLYNYFNNLNHLKSLAALTFSFDYINDLKICARNAKNSYELNRNIWECFYQHSYRQSDIFFSIFGVYKPKETENYINEFNAIYPDRFDDMDDVVKDMLLGETICDRTMYLLNHCAKEGYFAPEDLEAIDEQCYFIYRGMMSQLQLNQYDNEKEFVDKGMNYTDIIFENYKKTDAN